MNNVVLSLLVNYVWEKRIEYKTMLGKVRERDKNKQTEDWKQRTEGRGQKGVRGKVKPSN